MELDNLSKSISETCEQVPLTTISSITLLKSRKRQKLSTHPTTCLARHIRCYLSEESPGDVIVTNPNDIAAVYTSGTFGKGSVSRGEPIGCLDQSEHLILSPCEAMYLVQNGSIYVTKNNDHTLTVPELWEIWRGYNADYHCEYAVYRFFRNKKYVVRSGLKYGGNFALYTGDPNTAHAAYIVAVHDSKGDSPRWSDVNSLRRVSESVGKECILAYTDFKGNDVDGVECLDDVSIVTILLKRWLPERGRELET